MKLVKGFLLETTEGHEGIVLTKQGVFQRVRLDTYSAIGEEVYGSIINVGNKNKGPILIGLFFAFFILTQAFFNPEVTVGAGSYPSQPPSKVVKNKIKEESLILNDSKVFFLVNNEKDRYQTLISPRLKSINQGKPVLEDFSSKTSKKTLKTKIVREKAKEKTASKKVQEKKGHWKETGKKPGSRSRRLP